jgi:periplasmic protein TonB
MNPDICYPLARALALSLVLHAALLASGARLAALLPSIARPPDLTLKVRLADPLPAPRPELLMREDTPREAPPTAKPATKPVGKRLVRPPAEPKHAASASGVEVLSGEPARRAREQIARELLYPLEAVERGLEGEVLVMLFLDDAGNAIAARVETSSGHRILDEAAVRAARTLRSLPASAPREARVPVRFRLR